MDNWVPSVLGILGFISGATGLIWGYFQAKEIERIRGVNAKELEAFKTGQVREIEDFKSGKNLEIETFKSQQSLELEKFKSNQVIEIEKFKSERSLEIENIRYLKGLEADYDRDLRIRRIDAYQKLWQILKEWESPDILLKLNHEIIVNFFNLAETWYYTTGGLFLTNESNKAFIQLRTKVFSYLSGINSDLTRVAKITSNEIWLEVYKVIDALKEQMLKDINTRKVITLNEKIAPPASPIPAVNLIP